MDPPGWRILLSYLYPHFIFRRLLCRPYPPSPPLPSHPLPCFSGSSLLGWVSLSPFFPPSSLSDRPRQKTCQFSLPLPLPLPVHGHGGGGGGRGEGWTKGVGGVRVIFFRGHRGGGWMIFATISLGKSIPTPGRQAGRPTNPSLRSRFRNIE